MSCGALAVALINDRVPVFEIVVCLLFSSFPITLSAAPVKRASSLQLFAFYGQNEVAGKGGPPAYPMPDATIQEEASAPY